MAIQSLPNLDRAFRALGDGTRRQMVAMLAQRGVLTASELRAPFDAAQPTISKHLKVLEQAGLVRRHVAGRTHRFELSDSALGEAQDWISVHREFWEGTLAQLESYVSARPRPSGPL